MDGHGDSALLRRRDERGPLWLPARRTCHCGILLDGRSFRLRSRRRRRWQFDLGGNDFQPEARRRDSGGGGRKRSRVRICECGFRRWRRHGHHTLRLRYAAGLVKTWLRPGILHHERVCRGVPHRRGKGIESCCRRDGVRAPVLADHHVVGQRGQSGRHGGRRRRFSRRSSAAARACGIGRLGGANTGTGSFRVLTTPLPVGSSTGIRKAGIATGSRTTREGVTTGRGGGAAAVAAFHWRAVLGSGG